MSRKFGIANPGVPIIFIGNSTLLGESEITDRFESEILIEKQRLAFCNETVQSVMQNVNSTCTQKFSATQPSDSHLRCCSRQCQSLRSSRAGLLVDSDGCCREQEAHHACRWSLYHGYVPVSPFRRNRPILGIFSVRILTDFCSYRGGNRTSSGNNNGHRCASEQGDLFSLYTGIAERTTRKLYQVSVNSGSIRTRTPCGNPWLLMYRWYLYQHPRSYGQGDDNNVRVAMACTCTTLSISYPLS